MFLHNIAPARLHSVVSQLLPIIFHMQTKHSFGHLEGKFFSLTIIIFVFAKYIYICLIFWSSIRNFFSQEGYFWLWQLFESFYDVFNQFLRFFPPFFLIILTNNWQPIIIRDPAFFHGRMFQSSALPEQPAVEWECSFQVQRSKIQYHRVWFTAVRCTLN